MRPDLEHSFSEIRLLTSEKITILDTEDDLPVDVEFLGKTTLHSFEFAMWHNGNGHEPLLGNTSVGIGNESSWRVYASLDGKTRYLLSSS